MKTLRFGVKIGLILLPAQLALAAPFGYSVNSDEPAGDHLFRIDLATGQEQKIGQVHSLGVVRSDIEGMAFDSFGVLWAVDDESRKLFPVSTSTGQVVFENEVSITGLSAVQGNDFGLTFTCDGELFVSSVASRTLYRLALNGTATPVGGPGALGVNISAIAAYGRPARIYGLGNGLLGEGGPADNRSLYEIDLNTGQANLIGPIGNAAGDYFEAGLSFDDAGRLWAITDRRTPDASLGSQILQLDRSSGQATLVATTTVTGFESLAVSGPPACTRVPPNEPGREEVQIPTLDGWGRMLAILALLAVGWAAIRRRPASR